MENKIPEFDEIAVHEVREAYEYINRILAILGPGYEPNNGPLVHLARVSGFLVKFYEEFKQHREKIKPIAVGVREFSTRHVGGIFICKNPYDMDGVFRRISMLLFTNMDMSKETCSQMFDYELRVENISRGLFVLNSEFMQPFEDMVLIKKHTFRDIQDATNFGYRENLFMFPLVKELQP